MKKSTFLLALLTLPFALFALPENSSPSQFPLVFFFIVILLLAGRVGALVELFNQPAVLGELVMGILLAALAFLPLFSGLLNLSHDPLISGIAEIGVLLLLFQTGLK
ncbi:MAG: hypothetical protein WC371_00825, partial [Parachlamydiales bacterium]